MSNNTSNDEVFEYMGRGQNVPKDVVRVRFHPSVVKVDDYAFCECHKLKEVVLNGGLQRIGERAFYACKSLEEIFIPSTVAEIGEEAFDRCNLLKEVMFSEGLMKTGQRAFACCEKLEHIRLPSTVTELGNTTFYDCINLKKVVLNEGLVKIRHGAFGRCCSLESVTIPSSVAEIGNYVFNCCTNLREVVCCEALPEIDYCTFEYCHKLERITFLNISTRLEDIIRAGQMDVQNKIQQFVNRGDIEWRRGDIYIPRELTRRSRDGWSLIRERVDQIVSWIKYYEMKEATALFELALWKAKIDSVDENTTTLDRNVFRIDVPGPVKDAILQYLQ